MRKWISGLMMGVVMASFGMGLSGCSDEAGTKTTTTTTSPGGKTVESSEVRVKTSGENPPPAGKTP
jgi:hypothetical protein